MCGIFDEEILFQIEVLPVASRQTNKANLYFANSLCQ